VEFDELFYVEKMEPERIPKQLMGYVPRETRSIRRLKFRWKDQYYRGRERLEK
jgi:hypothetical protein